jgi:hypothetical protein
MTAMMITQDGRVWAARALLALLLLCASEVWLWAAPGRTLESWALVALTALALAALLLHTAALFRARNLYDVLTLGGLYGIGAGLLLYPDSVMADVPRTLITRGLGAHALLGAVAFGLWLALTGARPHRAALLAGALIMGAVCGLWARWSPVDLFNAPETPLSAILLVTAASLRPARQP